MPEALLTRPALVLAVGALVVVALALKAGLQRVRVPPLLGYLALGLALRWVQARAGVDAPQPAWVLGFLGELGLVCLLFKVGVECDPVGLVRELPGAVWVWFWNVALSAGLAYVVARHALGLALVPSLFVATAFSATSVGVAVAVWDDLGHLRTRLGRRLLDVAELDDLSAVAFVVLLLGAVPVLARDGLAADGLATLLLRQGLWLLAKGLVLAAACWALARLVERGLDRLAALERGPDPLLTVVGLAFVVAGAAGALGFSAAIGAFFAGLLFSRAVHRVHGETPFLSLYDLLTPFFFVDMAYHLELGALGEAWRTGLVLLVPATLGKLLGGGLPLVRREGLLPAAQLAVSLLPRAEIALVVMGLGRALGPEVVPPHLYGGVLFVSAVLCLVTPLALGRLLALAPPADGDPSRRRPPTRPGHAGHGRTRPARPPAAADEG